MIDFNKYLYMEDTNMDMNDVYEPEVFRDEEVDLSEQYHLQLTVKYYMSAIIDIHDFEKDIHALIKEMMESKNETFSPSNILDNVVSILYVVCRNTNNTDEDMIIECIQSLYRTQTLDPKLWNMKMFNDVIKFLCARDMHKVIIELIRYIPDATTCPYCNDINFKRHRKACDPAFIPILRMLRLTRATIGRPICNKNWQ